MKLTNKLGLPQPYVALCEKAMNNHPKFDENTFSVTELLKSPKQIYIKRKYDDILEVDVSDIFNLVCGTVMHKALEEEAGDGYLTEQRLEYDLGDGITLSGAFDLLNKETWEMDDWKTSKKATAEKNFRKESVDWYDQQRWYAIMAGEAYGKRPVKSNLVPMVQDFSQINHDYPVDHNVFRFGWSFPKPSNEDEIEDEMAFIDFYRDKAIIARDLLLGNEKIEDHPCTPDDCWMSEDWCIMKEGQPKACRGSVKKSEEEVRQLYETEYKSKKDAEKYRIHHREKGPINCMYYCPCRAICEQAKEMMETVFDEDITDSKELPF